MSKGSNSIIVQKEHPVLRQHAEEIPLAEIQSPKIKKILKQMSDALDSQDDGVAIAAPQIAVPLRIFLVSGRYFDEQWKQRTGKIPETWNNIVCINPEITKMSKDRKNMPEGCLSVRWLFGKVKRASRASIRAYDAEGNMFEKDGRGLLAQIFQHEIDHLNGALFIDTATDVKDLPPEE